jgi:hypothetical protein
MPPIYWRGGWYVARVEGDAWRWVRVDGPGAA